MLRVEWKSLAEGVVWTAIWKKNITAELTTELRVEFYEDGYLRTNRIIVLFKFDYSALELLIILSLTPIHTTPYLM
jgi:hypothetical protein